MEIRLCLKRGVDASTASPPALAQSLSLLRGEPVTEDQLSDDLASHGAGHRLPELFYVLDRFKSRGWIDYTVLLDDVVLARIVPLNGSFRLTGVTVDPERGYQLSRFAFLRPEGGRMVIESALVDARVVIESPLGGAVAAALGQPCTVAEAARTLLGAPERQTGAWFELFARVGLIHSHDQPEPPELATWEFHDALFHHATRSESLLQRTGATMRFRGVLSPLPALKVEARWDTVELPPAPTDTGNGPLFWDVLDRRRSLRMHSTAALPLTALSDFLYQVAKIRQINTGADVETIFRRYPAAGAVHEIEFYIAINDCEGLDRGLYHYNPARHILARLPATEKQVHALLSNASKSWSNARLPQALVILCSRFPRIAWGYERIAYRLTLLNAGAIIQTMYLVATAMGLAPCAIGWGDSGLFASAAGLDPMTEGSVAEFAIGLPE